MVKGHNNTFHVSKLAAVPNIDHRYFGLLSTTRDRRWITSYTDSDLLVQ
jgi:hypothetical protein